MITLEPASNELIQKANKEVNHNFKLDNCQLLGIYNGNTEIGLLELQTITKICANVHIHILKEFQHKGYSLHAYNPLLRLSKLLGIKTLIATIPMNNKPMIRILQKTNFKCSGNIPNAIIYNNQLQDLVLFNLEVN